MVHDIDEDPLPTFDSLVDMLETRAAAQPDDLAARFLGDGERETARITYGTLAARGRSRTSSRRTAPPGDRALLLYPPGLEYIAAFFGCLYAGVLAVPAYPPDPSRLQRTLPRLRAILADCAASVALTDAAIHGIAGELFGDVVDAEGRPVRWIATDTLAARAAPLTGARLSEVAFVQYTSGSTAAPRGVMVTHDNLLHNLRAIARRLRGDRPSFVFWLPPYHDMGLIGGILSPIYRGGTLTLMSPLHFLQRPLRWLQAVSRYRGVVSAAPSFAFELCVRKSTPEDRERLDLSSWRSVCNGAEPISPATLQRFSEAFAPSGFHAGSFLPCYGLAEGTLMTTGKPSGAPNVVRHFLAGSVELGRPVPCAPDAEGARPLASSGSSIEDQRLAIVDPESRGALGDGEVGEIWVASPSVARGYFGRDAETEATFGGHLAGSDEGPFLRTGDLGFLREGELFVTGRIKDLIIVAGQNHYPQDLERTAEQSHPSLRPGGSAAFAIERDGQKRAAIVVEVDGAPGAEARRTIEQAVVAAMAAEHRLSLAAVVVVERNAVPRTSSGKVQRHACREAFLRGSLLHAPPLC